MQHELWDEFDARESGGRVQVHGEPGAQVQDGLGRLPEIALNPASMQALPFSFDYLHSRLLFTGSN
jgi:hypothetical protein